jgi:hypothetical protein
MTESSPPVDQRWTWPRQLSPVRAAGIGLAVAAVAAVLWGGYGHHWRWTGIKREDGHAVGLRWGMRHTLVASVWLAALAAVGIGG